jgi:hypothetical protein
VTFARLFLAIRVPEAGLVILMVRQKQTVKVVAATPLMATGLVSSTVIVYVPDTSVLTVPVVAVNDAEG